MVAVNVNIIVNIIVVTCESYKNSLEFAYVIYFTNYVCYFLMCIEVMIKIVALGKLFF